jgi:hypothetical protein
MYYTTNLVLDIVIMIFGQLDTSKYSNDLLLPLVTFLNNSFYLFIYLLNNGYIWSIL